MLPTRKFMLYAGLAVVVSSGWVDAAPEWVLRSETGPAPRTHHAMAWDSCRNVAVLFGGDLDGDLAGRYGDTWEWNGSEWSLRATTGPSLRTSPAMSFDSSRCVTVLFGGVDASDNRLNDTWEWDGSTWTQKCEVGCTLPSVRYVANMTYDASQQVSVLFGGYITGFTLLNDTWIWDGSTWTQVTTTTPRPAPRSGHALGYDPVRQRVVLFGGNLAPTICGTNSDETWELDLSVNPATWTQITATPRPSPRRKNGHLVYDPMDNRMLLFGGTNFCGTQPAMDDTWAYDAEGWTQLSTTTAPQGRHGHDLVYDTLRQEVVVFGGDLGPINNYDVSGDTWTLAEAEPDSDGDGVADVDDNCPSDANPEQADGDGDGMGDACDGCPDDSNKTEPGICDCNAPDTDTDGDGTFDCHDDCPGDANKTESGICDCGTPDTDTDGDGTVDCDESCPNDPNKIAPGICGCGVADAIGFVGFRPPISGADATGGSFADPLRAFKLGSTIPIKFMASQCGDPQYSGIHTLAAVKYSSAVDSDPPIDATPTDAATTGNQFRLADGEWHFNLGTKNGFSKGTWKLIATLSDGSQHSAWITIKK